MKICDFMGFLKVYINRENVKSSLKLNYVKDLNIKSISQHFYIKFFLITFQNRIDKKEIKKAKG